MKRMYVIGLVVLLAAVWAPVGAQEGDDDDQGTCLYDGRSYVTGVAVCQSGQILTCVDGEWQTTNRFCNAAPDGEALGMPALEGGAVEGAQPLGEDDD